VAGKASSEIVEVVKVVLLVVVVEAEAVALVVLRCL
jgi:hypothetical protein